MTTPDFDPATFLGMVPGSTKDTNALTRLAQAYDKSTRNSLAKLATAVEQRNLVQIKDVGHKLKSGSRWFGAHALGSLGEQLEKLPNAIDMDTLPPLLKAAEASFANVTSEVAKTLARLRHTQKDGHAAE